MLKPDQPNAVQLLGMKLVAWKAPSSREWSVLEDVCPHRLAPLSEGRLHTDGSLMCSYHGWTFDASGGCTSIPQLEDPKAHATACSSARACVKRFPCQELHGLLWVWAESSPAAWVESAAGPPAAAVPELLSGDWEITSVWFQRDLPLSLDIMVENFLDPSHVPFSHHGVVGDRNQKQTMVMQPTSPVSRDAGFSTYVTSTLGRSYPLAWHPPCLAKHQFDDDLTMLLYGVPTAPGWCRAFMTNMSTKGTNRTRPETPQLPWLVNRMIDFTDSSTWLQHALTRNAIVDGDTYFLHAAERRLYAKGDHTSWRKQYYMPSSADAAVIAWRKWIDRHGAALPLLPRSAADVPPLMPREQVMDRYHQHTKDCPQCSQALTNINIAAAVLAVVAAVAAGALVAAVVAGTAPLLSGFSAGAAAVAGVAAAVVAALLRLRQLFIFVDYVHAEH